MIGMKSITLIYGFEFYFHKYLRPISIHNRELASVGRGLTE